MTKSQNSKQYDLEERTLRFTKMVIAYCKNLARNISHFEISKQLIRSAGSVGANYIEANEALSKKDFLMRVKICRKEAKEARYWLNLTEPTIYNSNVKELLLRESTELMSIFGSIIRKME
ncbi:MAG: four helix bundle protein [Patescibacteria group bacterium]